MHAPCEGDIILGKVDDGNNLAVGGLITQVGLQKLQGTSRRLTAVKNYNAWFWPDGVVSQQLDVLCSPV
jgi:hypothetical protein